MHFKWCLALCPYGKDPIFSFSFFLFFVFVFVFVLGSHIFKGVSSTQNPRMTSESGQVSLIHWSHKPAATFIHVSTIIMSGSILGLKKVVAFKCSKFL
jgi:hypothetical protein